MLFSRYGAGAKDILSLDFMYGLEILQTAQRMNNEEKLFARWVVSYQTGMTYDEFKRKVNISYENHEDNRTEEEILESVKKILEGTHGTKHI